MKWVSRRKDEGNGNFQYLVQLVETGLVFRESGLAEDGSQGVQLRQAPAQPLRGRTGNFGEGAADLRGLEAELSKLTVGILVRSGLWSWHVQRAESDGLCNG